ncbi:MAG: hypothetical protein R3C03_05165 [Pirellulaceae bacterium]
MRAPIRSGECLVLPTSCHSVVETIACNRATLDGAETFLDSEPLSEWRKRSRTSLIEMAQAYSSQYLASCQIEAIEAGLDFESAPLVMAGHQPTLFHPGVWFKNFYLSEVSQKAAGLAINLIVDNDLAPASAVLVPKIDNDQAWFQSIAFDRPGPAVSFEERPVVDVNFFRTFPERLKSVFPSGSRLLVDDLWKYAGNVQSSEPLGNVVARMRHRLECDFGLRTLELPLSHVCRLPAFSAFVKCLIERAGEFSSIYNESLDQFRQLNGIRSISHPVPDLVSENGWFELPFWIWSKSHPSRSRLFVRIQGETATIGNLSTINLDVNLQQFHEQFETFRAQGIAIRPKALMTTAFARMLLSDYFIHGIGGAKYDELTDVILERFFGISAPRFGTATATIRLHDVSPSGLSNDLRDARAMLRAMRYHPEQFVDRTDSVLAEAVIRKEAIVEDIHQQGTSLERHQKIAAANAVLVNALDLGIVSQEKSICNLERELAQSRVLGSREVSIACFQPKLLDELSTLAKSVC